MKKIRLSFILSLLFFIPSWGWAQWEEDDRESGCIRYKGPKKQNLLPMKAVCTWSLSPKAVKRVLKRPDLFQHCFSRVKVSQEVPTIHSALLMRVYQVHDASPVSDRAVYLDYRVEELSTEWKLHFNLAPLDEIRPTGTDLVAVKANRGTWTVTPHSKGVKVELESRYDPGGSVPRFMINWFISSGVQKMMDELRSCVKKD